MLMLLHVFLLAFATYTGMTHINSAYGQLILTGEVMDATAYISNGFNMSTTASTDTFPQGYVKITDHTNFPFFGDVFSLTNPFNGQQIIYFSIGDILILVGAIHILFQ